MKKIFAQQSFYDQKKKWLERILKQPLLELVLEYLPHLQPTLKEKEDTWEVVAIKLNDRHFLSNFEDHKRDDKKHAKEDKQFSLDEVPTLSGTFAREMFEQIMEAFIQDIRMHNATRGIVSTVHNPNGVPGMSSSLPVFDSYSTREEMICCKLFYMRGMDVQIKADLARERLVDRLKAGDNSTGSVAHTTDIEKVKEESEKLRIEVLLQELEKKNQKIDNLTKQNQKLAELNQELLGGVDHRESLS